MSTQILTELPRIQKTGMDFDSIMSEIRNIVRDNPNWNENWNEFYDSEAGTMLCSLMAWVADNMSSRQDLLYNEMFIGTAQDDRNKIRHLKQIGYIPKMAHASKVPIKIVLNSVTNSEIYLTPEFKPGDGFESRPSKISSFKGRDINGKSIDWEIIPFKDGKPDYKGGITLNPQDIEYTKDNENKTLYAVQGKTVYEEFIIPTSDGSYFDLREKNIASDSIQVYRKDTGELLKEAKSFLTIINENKGKEKIESPYIIEMNEDRSFRIKFAGKEFFDENKLLKAGTIISVFYRTCDGSLGNIKANYISQSTNFINKNGDAITANIYNYLPAVEGSDMESLDEAVKNGPTTLITMNRAVTPDDYDIILENNTNIFKTKTYTASNQPKKFKDYYGRFINPQETFVFTLLNKQHDGVPTEEYNNFPWITTIKQPRLNEKYIFNKGNFNSPVDIGATLYNSSLIIDATNTRKFMNSTLINLGDKFNSYVNKNNNFLKLVLYSKPTEEVRLNNIKFDILGETAGYRSLSCTDNELSNEDYARFIPKNFYNTKVPVDIKKNRILKFIMNDEAEFSIDFGSCFTNINSMNHAYLLWDNEPQSAEIDKDSETQESAKNRKGIVQIINDSVNNAISAIEADNKFEYSGVSKQLFGLNISTPDEPLNKSINKFRLDINDVVYEFTNSKSRVSDTYNDLNNFLNNCFAYGTNVKKIVLDKTIELTEEDKEILKDYRSIIYNKKYEATNSSDINAISITTSDISITKKMPNGKTISVQDPNSLEGLGLISILKNDSFGGPYRYDNKNIPNPMPSVEYKNIAEMIYEDNEKDSGRIFIKTPNKGKYASLFFESTGEDDFGRNILRIPFENKYSPKVIGMRTVTLLVDNILKYGTQYETKEATIGNVIFQNSCIFNDYDFKEIYASYKLEDEERIKIGSSYENYYYSGNKESDGIMKENVYGILGQVTKDIDTGNGIKKEINLEESDFNIKLTKDKQLTNSIFSINSDLDAIPSNYVEITTDDLNNLSGNIKLLIDNENIINLDAKNISNGIDLKNAFKEAVKDTKNNKKLINKFDHIFSIPFDNINRLTIRSLSKQDGSITFINEDPNNNETYKKLFGTTETNKYLYNLYNNISVGDKDYFCPSIEKPIVFNYRTIKNGESRGADYNIQVEETSNGMFSYYLNKNIEGSMFPDSEFYMHFVNDKEGYDIETDESILQNYMRNKKVSGTDIIFLQPYFKTYDIYAEITYLPMFNETEIKNNIVKEIDNLCGLKNAQIDGYISKAKIFKSIMNINGVSNCNIKYFGYNVNDEKNYPSQEAIKSNFYEISCLHESTEDRRGLSLLLVQE